MEIFYVVIILLGILTVIGALFFIGMDKANGKDFFKEFDRKKDEMYNLVQESDEMIQELNKMSDYVVSMITEKNKEFFDKVASSNNSDKTDIKVETAENQDIVGDKLTSTTVTYSPPVTVRVKPNIAVTPNAVTSSNKQKLEETKIEVPADNTEKNNNEIPTVNEVENVLPDEIEAKNNSIPVDSNKSKLTLNFKRQEALEMIKQGKSDDEIADRLKIGKGEIGLIRGLSK